MNNSKSGYDASFDQFSEPVQEGEDETGTSDFGGFGPTARTHFLRGFKLRILRVLKDQQVTIWTKEGRPCDPPDGQNRIAIGIDATSGAAVYKDGSCATSETSLERVLSTCVVGRCDSEDEVCLINRDTRATAFRLRIESDETTKQEWENTRCMLLDSKHKGNAGLLRYISHFRNRLEELPPTATLGWVDFENKQTPDSWYFECKIPIGVLRRLEADLLEFHVRSVEIEIEWANGLIQGGHYAPNRHARWGMLVLDKEREPLPLFGHVTGISWTVEPLRTRRNAPPQSTRRNPLKSLE